MWRNRSKSIAGTTPSDEDGHGNMLQRQQQQLPLIPELTIRWDDINTDGSSNTTANNSSSSSVLSSSSSTTRFQQIRAFILRRRLLLFYEVLLLCLIYNIAFHRDDNLWHKEARRVDQERIERCGVLRRIEEQHYLSKTLQHDQSYYEKMKSLALGMSCQWITQEMKTLGKPTSYLQTPPLPSLPMVNGSTAATTAVTSSLPRLLVSPYYTRLLGSLYSPQMNRLTETEGLFDRYEDLRTFEAGRRQSDWWNSEEDQQPSKILRRMRQEAEEEDTKPLHANSRLIQSDAMLFDPITLRNSTTPALWIEGSDQLDGLSVKWNAAAEARFSQLIRAQQWPVPPVDCTKQKYVIIRQWVHGFFSRYDVTIRAFIRLLGATDRQIILGYHSMQHWQAAVQANIKDDYLSEGILQYFTPWSQCQNHPYVVDMISRGDSNLTALGVPMITDVTTIPTLLKQYSENQFIMVDCLMWYGAPVPASYMRRAIFDYGLARQHTEERYQVAVKRLDPAQFEQARHQDEMTGLASSTQRLTSTRLGTAAGSVWKHVTGLNPDSNEYEHIYGEREARALHQGAIIPSSEYQNENPRTGIYNEWLTHMVHAYLWQLAPRIEIQRNLITEYWSDVILKKQYRINTGVPTLDGNSPANVHHFFGEGQFAALRIRRGDKEGEDPYTQAKGHFRHAALFLHAVHKRELTQRWKFKGIYLQSDDPAEMARLLSYSKIATEDEKMSTDEEIAAAYESKDDNKIARAHLKGRWILYNQLSPPACEDPASHAGYEAFLASLSWMLHHRCFIVGHENSNISKFLARMAHVQQNLKADETRATPINARHVDVGDTFDD